MSESTRSVLIGKLSNKHFLTPMSSSAIINGLMEAMEAEDLQELINRIHQMSLDLDILHPIPEHLSEIQSHLSKIRRLMPEEVK